jgi:hypothetical protein
LFAALSREGLCFDVDYCEDTIDGRKVRACLGKVVPCDHGDEPWRPRQM